MTQAENWQIKLLYDGQCPLCLKEVTFLQRRDQGRGLICFVDITDDDYDPALHGGVTFEAAMERIHGVLADGTVLQNVAVFRYIYEILGLGWVYGITKIPAIGRLADWVYGIWAKYRLKLTGRPDLITLIQAREKRQTCPPEAECRL